MSLFTFPDADAAILAPYLPSAAATKTPTAEVNGVQSQFARPFVTLTYASSLESAVTLTPGRSTAISGPASLSMTHYLRSHHDAILIGVKALLADNPSLNCRLAGPAGTVPAPHLRPIIIDPTFRCGLCPDTKVVRLSREGRGLAPYIVIAGPSPPASHPSVALLESLGGKVIAVAPLPGTDPHHQLQWHDILAALAAEGVRSVMIEGGATVISGLMGCEGRQCVDVIIVTMAPKWFGNGCLPLTLPRVADPASGEPVPSLELDDVRWHQLGNDVILCGRPRDRKVVAL